MPVVDHGSDGRHASSQCTSASLVPLIVGYTVDMKVSDEAIREYMEIYRKDIGEELTVQQAREITSRLVALYSVLCKRLPTESQPQGT